MRKWLIIIILTLIAIFVSYNYIYKDHRNIESEKAKFVMTSTEIVDIFSKNMVTAQQKFLNKTIEVSGLISEINTNDLTIDDKIFCQFSNNINTRIDKTKQIKIKGRVIGYDDLLEQVKLDQCTIE